MRTAPNLAVIIGSPARLAHFRAIRPSASNLCSIAVEEAGSALLVLRELLTPDQPTLGHVIPDLTVRLDLIEKEIESWADEGIHLVTVLDEQYPVQLLMVHQRPPFLTCKGFLDPADQFGVAVVGSRRASARGLHITREIATTLTKHDITVFSGLATGVDTAAHRAAVDAGGRTVSVVGTGLRHSYPVENADLQQEIARTGAVLSQFWPDAGPAKHHFPMRNAVMSGCSVATVVVEAANTVAPGSRRGSHWSTAAMSSCCPRSYRVRRGAGRWPTVRTRRCSRTRTIC